MCMDEPVGGPGQGGNGLGWPGVAPHQPVSNCNLDGVADVIQVPGQIIT